VPVQCAIEIGKRLMIAKKVLPHGEYALYAAQGSGARLA